MSIVRVVHNKENPYVMINKKSLWDKELSLEAVGLWSRLLSKPDDWEIKSIEIQKSCDIGIKKVYSLLDQLVRAGYAYRFQPRAFETGKGKKKGDFDSIITYVFEYKVTKEEIQNMFALGHLAQAPVALSAKEDTTNKEEVLNTEITKSPLSPNGDRPFPKSKKSKQEKHEVAKHVWLTNAQREELVRRFGDEKAVKCYDKLSLWKLGKGIEARPNDFKSILGWVIKAVEEDELKPKPVDRIQVDKSLAKKVEDKFPNHPDISFGHNYIEFNFGAMSRPYLKFGDNGFEEQLHNCLRKMGLKL